MALYLKGKQSGPKKSTFLINEKYRLLSIKKILKFKKSILSKLLYYRKQLKCGNCDKLELEFIIETSSHMEKSSVSKLCNQFNNLCSFGRVSSVNKTKLIAFVIAYFIDFKFISKNNSIVDFCKDQSCKSSGMNY